MECDLSKYSWKLWWGCSVFWQKACHIAVLKGKICLYVSPKMVKESSNINVYFSLFIKVIIIGDMPSWSIGGLIVSPEKSKSEPK